MKIVPNFVVETIQLMPVLNCQCYCQMTSHSGILYYVIKTTYSTNSSFLDSERRVLQSDREPIPYKRPELPLILQLKQIRTGNSWSNTLERFEYNLQEDRLLKSGPF